MYEDNDIRRDWAIAPFDYKDDGTKEYRTDNETQIWGRYSGKFRREYETVSPKTSFTPINFPLLRYSDVLLMLAEAENYLHGPTEAAISAINTVEIEHRQRHWKEQTCLQIRTNFYCLLRKSVLENYVLNL